jgi:hypothetical protein
MRQYNPEDSSEHHTRRRENLKSHIDHRFMDFSAETTVTGHVYLDMLEHFLVPHLDVNNVIWQQREALPH